MFTAACSSNKHPEQLLNERNGVLFLIGLVATVVQPEHCNATAQLDS
jgi:hypothetical protein